MTLFRLGDFTAHSGETLRWKIACDALSDEDWKGLAAMALEVVGDNFCQVTSVPRGGDKLAYEINALIGSNRHPAWPRLIADDVLTTGASMRAAMDRPDDIGLVVFARGALPERVTALFSMPAALRDVASECAEIAYWHEPDGRIAALIRSRFNLPPIST
jgi:hypothetical protein